MMDEVSSCLDPVMTAGGPLVPPDWSSVCSPGGLSLGPSSLGEVKSHLLGVDGLEVDLWLVVHWLLGYQRLVDLALMAGGQYWLGHQ